MQIDSAVTLLPLRQEHLSPAIDAFYTKLSELRLEVDTREVSKFVRGELENVFAGVQEAYKDAFQIDDANLVIVVRNS